MVAFAVRDTSSTVQCHLCRVSYSILYNREDMIDWLAGKAFIQDLMPYLSAAERELLISGMCGSCFDKMFPSPIDTDNDE